MVTVSGTASVSQQQVASLVEQQNSWEMTSSCAIESDSQQEIASIAGQGNTLEVTTVSQNCN